MSVLGDARADFEFAARQLVAAFGMTHGLSDAERAATLLAVLGLGLESSAALLRCNPRTFKDRLARARRKVGASSTAALVRIVTGVGLFDGECSSAAERREAAHA